MKLQSGYTIRFARAEELSLLPAIERSANRLFLDTPYAFLVDGETLPFDFIQQRFTAGQVWVAVTCQENCQEDDQNNVVGFAVTREVDDTLYLQEIDVHPDHGQRGIGSALVHAICDWARLQGHCAVSLSTFRDIPWNAPFYAKLGFRILDEFELTIGLQKIRLQEEEAGLPVLERVMMLRDLEPAQNDDG